MALAGDARTHAAHALLTRARCPLHVPRLQQAPSVLMFGMMSIIFTLRERVESSVEMVRAFEAVCAFLGPLVVSVELQLTTLRGGGPEWAPRK
jgi:hypothetical protein